MPPAAPAYTRGGGCPTQSPGRDQGDRWWVQHLEERLRQLRVGRQVLLDLLRQSEQRRQQQVAALEAQLRRLRRRLRGLEVELAAARRELARLRAQAGNDRPA